jgi:exodeoxyribonuclease-5
LKTNPAYILKGYAGTGKTSLLGAYVKALTEIGKQFVLLAPTGRAAKVLANYTGFRAHTIHRQIYHLTTSPEGNMRLMPAYNPMKNTVFIIDEASMINDNSSQGDSVFNTRSLLDDLINYVFSRERNKILLVGDTAQLPPVGLNISPALNFDYIKNVFNLAAYSFEMKEVRRQALDSGVLNAATELRQKISSFDQELPYFSIPGFKKDVIRIDNGTELEELLNHTYSGRDFEKGIVVCRSNKRANLFNQQVRNRILQFENEIEGGDFLMVVRNNYYWLDEKSQAGFIANGDLIRLVRILKVEEMYGFRFADVEIELLDYPEEKEIEVKILLNTLGSDGPGLTESDSQQLFEKVEEDYIDIPERRKRMGKMKKNRWLNALHVKFAYAMTCHKTQGGQWPVVIIDQGYLTDENINSEYQRWLYTALTRSTEKVYLVNFRDEFFD